MGRTLQNFKHLVNRDTSMSGLELDPTFMDHISSKAARMSISCFSALNPLLYFPTLSLHHPSPRHLISSFLCLLPEQKNIHHGDQIEDYIHGIKFVL